jgi:hypothetical protein
LKRDVFIEVVGIFLLSVVVIACSGYVSHQQTNNSRGTRSILQNMYELQKEDLRERSNHRKTIDERLTTIEDGQKQQLDDLKTEQVILDGVATRLKIETKNRKSGLGTLRNP